MGEAEAIVALSLVPGVGPGRIQTLLRHLGSGRAAFRAPAHVLSALPGIGPATAGAIRRFDQFEAVRRQFVRARRCGAQLLAVGHGHYPALLREIYDPPAFLWMRGDLTEADGRAVAVVGTRRPTDYGRRVAASLSAGLARAGLTVVSGLAYGIDVEAHRAALEAGGRTLAVLGSGVDRIYPGHHIRIARDIVRSGAILSEYPMGAAPDAVNFPRRNRVISGLCLGTLVVEAYDSGGALITAKLALEQNREVFAVPSSIYNDAGEGANALIRAGAAKLVTRVRDVLEELDVDVLVDEPDETVRTETLNRDERSVYTVLGPEPVHVDVICERSGLDSASALVILLNLEFKQYVRQLAGMRFVRV